MRVMAIDFGRKRVGLALSDPLGMIASPLAVLERKEGWWQELLSLVQRHEVTEVVIGLPREMNGTVGPAGEACQRFAREFEEKSGLIPVLVDERLSSAAASSAMSQAGVRQKQQRGRLDSVAASLLLQVHLQRRAKGGSP